MEETMMNETMANEVGTEMTGNVAAATSKSGLKTAAKVGGIALIGVGIYKLGKLIATKIKARKNKKHANDKDVECVEEAECVEVDSVDAE